MLLRTGQTPLSKVMRRLMTGYAITFNKRHKRAGHLFQNRYKSIICEEDPYLLELIRYVHLNPLRAKLVNDLKELDTYPWAGHSAILARCKNPLIPEASGQKSEVQNGGSDNKHPENPVNPVQYKSLAEKTIEDVLLHFGETQKVARRRYREFVEKGIDQGRRPEFQGGGLVRSAGGSKTGLLGRPKEEREKGDARILGSGNFVSSIIKEGSDSMNHKAQRHVSLDDLVSRVCSRSRITPDELASKRRKRDISHARAALCYLAVDELNYSGEELARLLSISGRGVSDCRDRGQKILLCREMRSLFNWYDNPEIIREYLS